MKKKLLYFRISQLILALILMLFPLFGVLNDEGLVLNDYLKYIPVILGIGIILLTAFETKLLESIIRLSYLAVVTFVSIILLHYGGINMFNTHLWIVSNGYFILSLISVFKIKNDANKRKVTTTVGYFSVNNILVFIIFELLALFSFFYGVIFAVFAGGEYPYLIIVFFAPTIFFAVMLSIFLGQGNKCLNAINEFMKTADYERFMLDIDGMLENSSFKKATLKLKLMQVEYTFLVDKDRAIQMFSNIDLPKSIFSQMLYKIIEIHCYIAKNDFQTASELINELQTRHRITRKQIRFLKDIITVLDSEKEIKNIEKKYSIIRKKVDSLINASVLLNYYKRRGNLKKAKYYARYILHNTSQFKEIIKLSEDIVQN